MSTTPFQDVAAPTSRRSFFKRAGLGIGAAAVAANLQACDSEEDDDADVTLDFSNDFGVLNYAYALEQLEAAFYNTVVMDSAYATTFNADERAILDDLAAHEAIHRDFLRAAIVMAGGEEMLIPNLTPNFSSVDFDNRTSVLQTVARLGGHRCRRVQRRGPVYPGRRLPPDRRQDRVRRGPARVGDRRPAHAQCDRRLEHDHE